MLKVIMSRVLSELLGVTEPGFSQIIQQLEHASGHPSVDVRLSSELATIARRKNQQLGLDAQDTTGQELYQSLLLRVEKSDTVLQQAFGGLAGTDAGAAGFRALAVLKKLPISKTCWALKPAAAKKLLKSQPPKNVMKHLGYRSIDSMLKRENITEVYSALQFMESTQWQRRFVTRYKTLRGSDFETRPIDVSLLDLKKWDAPAVEYVKTHRTNLICDRIMGVIAILPVSETPVKGLTITMVALLANCLQQIRLCSVYCKLQQVRPDFGLLVSQAAVGNTGSVAELAGCSLSWPAFLYHFSNGDGGTENDLLELHLQPEDLEWQPVTGLLSSISPELEFWEDTDFLGFASSDGQVSYNLLDACISYCNNRAYPNRLVGAMRETLWYELLNRYLARPSLQSQTLKQLENKLLSIDPTITKKRKKKA